MNLELEDRVVIISGGARGIGRAIARSVAAEQGIPVIVDPQEREGADLVEQIEADGGQAASIARKLDSDDDCQQVVQWVEREFGRIDGVVNNAGRNDGAGLLHGSTEAFETSLRRNLIHCFSLVHHALPALKASRGAIVNISSKTALTGQGGTSGYSAAKGALLALTREWALDLLPWEIRVNAIVPAEVMTPAYQTWLNELNEPDATLKRIQERVPLGTRLTRPAEIADTAVFLLSARAAHITGQHIHVDGGYVHLDRALGQIERES
ncbi:SDR family oxidoreductase [Elongatibacter sediminis]|uniref:SDR family oxidoreductase n=1 Tax=Elongatibacter sediminis TaxID=3119006 RepID=A0AAW9RE25_9GAMM